MGSRTPLYDRHVALGARMVDFGGWDMPLQYASQIDEHHAVRKDAGMFDVSHMCVVDLKGAKVRGLLQYLLANDVGRLTAPGKALYSCMLKEDGGVIDDLIVYFMTESWFRMVVNAGTRDKDLAWIAQQAQSYGLDVEERKDLAMIAVQGPKAREKAATVLPAEQRSKALALETFFGAACGDLFVARTGYTGEDGWEIMTPAARAVEFWDALQKAGIVPAGLGARDTLRLEAGMNLYGNDMNETVSPLDAGLAWTVELKSARDFIGKAALVRNGKQRSFFGLKLLEKGVMRAHQRVVTPAGDGEVTSGTFSPTLNVSIGLARMPLAVKVADTVAVDIRGKQVPAQVVKLPFVRNGRILV